MSNTQALRIGEVASILAVTVDTLRYYERIKLLPKVRRSQAGIREYATKDVSRLKFIKRAQNMGFSLIEISQLLKLREQPNSDKAKVRTLANQKLAEVEARLEELNYLRQELISLSGSCSVSKEQDRCPILDKMDEDSAISKSK